MPGETFEFLGDTMNTPVASRPGRKMPAAEVIHKYWTEQRLDDAIAWFGQIDPGEPSCYACGRRGGFKAFERAHLVDRVFDGLDNPANLALLCAPCHAHMPSHDPREYDDAVMWVRLRAPHAAHQIIDLASFIAWVIAGGAKSADLLANLTRDTDPADLTPDGQVRFYVAEIERMLRQMFEKAFAERRV